MLEDYLVSVFNGVNPNVVDNWTINEVLDSIKIDHFKEIETLRGIPPEQKEKRNLQKKKLKAVTFSGTFETLRRKERLKSYNPIIVLDIDKLDLDTLKDQFQMLIDDKYVLACWISPSGNGIKGLVPISYEKGLLDGFEITEKAHKAAFQKVSSYFFTNYNVELDPKGDDVPRLCFLSHDPYLHRKKNVTNYKISRNDIDVILDHNIPRSKKTRIIEYNTDIIGNIRQSEEAENDKKQYYAYNRNLMQRIVKYLEKRDLSITKDYKSWIYVAFALSTTFPYITAKKYYLRLCRLDGVHHDESKSNWQFDRCYRCNRGIISLRTILYYAREVGYYGGSREDNAVPKA